MCAERRVVSSLTHDGDGLMGNRLSLHCLYMHSVTSSPVSLCAFCNKITYIYIYMNENVSNF